MTDYYRKSWCPDSLDDERYFQLKQKIHEKIEDCDKPSQFEEFGFTTPKYERVEIKKILKSLLEDIQNE